MKIIDRKLQAANAQLNFKLSNIVKKEENKQKFKTEEGIELNEKMDEIDSRDSIMSSFDKQKVKKEECIQLNEEMDEVDSTMSSFNYDEL